MARSRTDWWPRLRSCRRRSARSARKSSGRVRPEGIRCHGQRESRGAGHAQRRSLMLRSRDSVAPKPGLDRGVRRSRRPAASAWKHAESGARGGPWPGPRARWRRPRATRRSTPSRGRLGVPGGGGVGRRGHWVRGGFHQAELFGPAGQKTKGKADAGLATPRSVEAVALAVAAEDDPASGGRVGAAA